MASVVAYDGDMTCLLYTSVFEQTAYNKGAMGLFVSKLAIVGDSHAIEFVNWMRMSRCSKKSTELPQ